MGDIKHFATENYWYGEMRETKGKDKGFCKALGLSFFFFLQIRTVEVIHLRFLFFPTIHSRNTRGKCGVNICKCVLLDKQ